jgi:hypothetical protein
MPMTFDGSGTITGLAAGGLPDATITQADLAAGVAGTGPAFSVSVTGTTTITSGVFTKMVFNSENWDTASCFDSTTNYRFTPTVAGYYLITGSLDAGTSTNANRAIPAIYKNGSSYRLGINIGTANGSSFGSSVSAQVYLNGSTDYVELFAYVLATTAQYTASTGTWFDGVLVRAA